MHSNFAFENVKNEFVTLLHKLVVD